MEGLLDAEDGGPGGLDAGGVLACGLAELFGALGHVEDVVDDLEGEAGFFSEGAQAGDGVGVGGVGSAACLNACLRFFGGFVFAVAARRAMTQA